MMLTQFDIEYLIIFAILAVLFFIGLKPTVGGHFQPFVIDKKMSQALKGIACVFVLMGHWGQRKFDGDMPWGVSRVVWQTTATTALVWFMFFSGYGMSLKKISQGEYMSKWWRSMKKIFIPCLLACFVMLLICALLPDNFTSEEIKQLWLPNEIHQLHHLDRSFILPLFTSLLGGGDWYVYCILMFYTIYYIVSFLSEKYHKNQTILLGIAFVLYWFWAHWCFGPEKGHYYRFVWTFMFGHAVAKRTKLSWVVAIVLMIPALIEQKIIIFDFFVGVFVLWLLSFISSKYEMRGKIILSLGTISYFFYLAHVRIGYTLLTYMGLDSILLWALLTILISFILYEIDLRFRR